jgi:signal peptidase I
MLGDNRDNSQDFRIIGFVNRDLILGKANAIAFSLDYENFYTPRGDRFFRELE